MVDSGISCLKITDCMPLPYYPMPTKLRMEYQQSWPDLNGSLIIDGWSVLVFGSRIFC
jgi:hypothetical protein